MAQISDSPATAPEATGMTKSSAVRLEILAQIEGDHCSDEK